MLGFRPDVSGPLIFVGWCGGWILLYVLGVLARRVWGRVTSRPPSVVKGLSVEERGGSCIVSGPSIPVSLAVRPEGAWTKLQKSVVGEDLLVNDEQFDRRINLRASQEDEEQVVARLDARTRADLIDLVERGMTIEGGHLKAGFGVDFKRRRNLLVRLATRLGRGPVTTLLVDNVRHDPVAGVRLRNLELLAANHSRSPEAAQAVRAALQDPEPLVRVRAAELKGGEGGLSALEAVVAAGPAPASVRAMALERLVSLHGSARAQPAVIVALVAGPEELRCAAVKAVGSARDVSQLDRVCSLAQAAGPVLAELIARSLGELNDARAEPTLIDLLGRNVPAVRCAAARALGEVGTVRAVSSLLPLAQALAVPPEAPSAARPSDGEGDSSWVNSWLLTGGELQQLAQDSIRRIQGRLCDVGTGHLSVARVEGVEGAVSVAVESGAVSLVPDKAGHE